VIKALKAGAFAVYLAFIVCLVFATAEYAARMYLSKTRGRGREQAEILIDRWAAFRLSPNYTRAGVHHNAQGFRRDQDVPVEKPANTVRIFLMGASTAYGAETVYPEIDARWKMSNHETIVSIQALGGYQRGCQRIQPASRPRPSVLGGAALQAGCGDTS
jgi:hypothetical protein